MELCGLVKFFINLFIIKIFFKNFKRILCVVKLIILNIMIEKKYKY